MVIWLGLLGEVITHPNQPPSSCTDDFECRIRDGVDHRLRSVQNANRLNVRPFHDLVALRFCETVQFTAEV